MTHTAANTVQTSFRGRDDTQTLNSTTFTHALNTNFTQAVDTDFRVRFLVEETAGGTESNADLVVYYNHNGGGWNVVTTTSPVQLTASSQFTDGDATSQVLGSGTFTGGEGDTNGTVTAITLTNSQAEMEYCLTIDSAQVADTDTIAIQVQNGGTALGAYTNNLTVTVEEAANTAVPLDAGSFSLTGYQPTITPDIFSPATALTSGNSTTNTTSFTTASITVTADQPVMVIVWAGSVSTSGNTAPTVSGASQTWTQKDSFIPQNTYDGGGGTYTDYQRVSTFTTPATSGGTGTLTIDFGSNSQDITTWAVLEIDSAFDFGTRDGTTATTSDQTSVSGTISAIGGTEYHLGIGLWVDYTNNTSSLTPRSGWSELVEEAADNSTYGEILQVQLSPIGGDTTVSMTAADAAALSVFAYPLIGATASVPLDAGAFSLTGYAPTTTKDVGSDLDAGSFSLTGYAATVGVTATTSVPLDAGSFAFTGLDATVSVTDTTAVPLDAGAFSLTGYAATITRDLNAALDAGLFALTGYTVDVSEGVNVALDTGSYALSGLGVDIVADRSVNLDAGSFTLTGYDATASVIDVTDVPLDAGSYVLSGLDTSVSVADTTAVPLDVGSFSLTGLGSALSFEWSLNFDAGSFSFTGLDVGVSTSGVTAVPLDAGVFSLTGLDVGATIEKPILLDAGSFAFTGLDATVSVADTTAVPLDAGAFSLTGLDASVSTTGTTDVPLDAGLFALTGYGADVASAYSIALNAGSFALSGLDVDVDQDAAVLLDAGSYAINGFGVDATLAVPVSLGVGAFALSGLDLLILTADSSRRRTVTEDEGANTTSAQYGLPTAPIAAGSKNTRIVVGSRNRSTLTASKNIVD